MKKIVFAFLAVLTFLSALTPTAGLSVAADTSSTSTFTVAAKSAIAVDAASGKILWAQDATDNSCEIASITKLITAYLVYQDIAKGKYKWTSKVPISGYAYELTKNSSASNIPLSENGKYTVKDLMDALLIPSANSAAVALAEYSAGSEPKFVNQMRALLKSWKITDATIVNSSGLPNSVLAGHTYPGSSSSATNTMSAQDVAIVCMHLIKDYPQILDITKETTAVFDKGGSDQTTLKNTNQMLPGFSNTRSGVDGLKTGSTGSLINCAAETTVQNGFRIITVVLDASSPAADNSTPFTLTNQLMNQVYGTWQAVGIVAKNEQIAPGQKVSIMDAKKASVPLVAKTNFFVVLPMDDPKYSVKIDKSKLAKLSAPIKAGTEIATASVHYKDSLGYLPGYNATVQALTVKSTVERANPFVVLWDNFVRFVNNKL